MNFSALQIDQIRNLPSGKIKIGQFLLWPANTRFFNQGSTVWKLEKFTPIYIFSQKLREINIIFTKSYCKLFSRSFFKREKISHFSTLWVGFLPLIFDPWFMPVARLFGNFKMDPELRVLFSRNSTALLNFTCECSLSTKRSWLKQFS